MEIVFRTKDESNRIHEEEFLNLIPTDRFYSFLALMIKLKKYSNSSDTKKDNLQIIIHA